MRLIYTGKNSHISGIPARDLDTENCNLEAVFGNCSTDQIVEYLVNSGLYKLDKPPKTKVTKLEKKQNKTEEYEETQEE